MLLLAVPLSAGVAPKGKKPRFDVRVTPRMAFSPVNVLVVAELVGGDDVEELYCPEIEWEWGDGGKSVQESDCPPYEPGAKLERRFTSEHEYRVSGSYPIKVTLRRDGRSLLSNNVTVTVRPGLGGTRE